MDALVINIYYSRFDQPKKYPTKNIKNIIGRKRGPATTIFGPKSGPAMAGPAVPPMTALIKRTQILLGFKVNFKEFAFSWERIIADTRCAEQTVQIHWPMHGHTWLNCVHAVHISKSVFYNDAAQMIISKCTTACTQKRKTIHFCTMQTTPCAFIVRL